jgi:hypothetical protein
MAGNLAKLASAVNKADEGNKAASFHERRSEVRLWCSDIVHVWVREEGDWRRLGVAVLEDISPSGMCIQVDTAISRGAAIRIKHAEWKVEGEVRYCAQREEGCFVGIRLSENFKWSVQQYRPMHLIDPSEVREKAEEQKAEQKRGGAEGSTEGETKK